MRKELEGLETLVKTLKGLAKQSLSSAEGQELAYYPKGLFEGSALAYESAAKWLERELRLLREE